MSDREGCVSPMMGSMVGGKGRRGDSLLDTRVFPLDCRRDGRHVISSHLCRMKLL